MQTENLIPAYKFCKHHKIEFSFINSLKEYGLIEITNIEQTEFINTNQLEDLEKFVRLHYSLDINLEGIEAITWLLEKVKTMQQEIISLKNKLRMYEERE